MRIGRIRKAPRPPIGYVALFALLPSVARADAPWAWGLAGGTLDWWVILVGLLIEWPVARYLTRLGWIRSIWPNVAMNLASTLVGLALLFLVLPLPLQWLFEALGALGIAIGIGLVIAMNTAVEGAVLTSAFRWRPSVRGIGLLYMANLLSVGAVVADLGHREIVTALAGRHYRSLAVPKSATSVALSDLDKDGRLDLVVSGEDSNIVSIFHGSGDGSFGPRVDVPVRGVGRCVAVVDLDGDSRLDLVLAMGDSLAFLHGGTDGSYRALGSIGVGHGPASLSVGDMNGDSLPDIVALSDISNAVTIVVGNRDSTVVLKSVFAMGARPETGVTLARGYRLVAIGDVDGDGRSDIAAARPDSDAVVLLLGDGEGGVRERVTLRPVPGPQAVVLKDLDGDGYLDLATANYVCDSVAIFFGSGSGRFPKRKMIRVGGAPLSVTAEDLNGDGRQDLAVACFGSDEVALLFGTEAGSFGKARRVWTQPQPCDIAIGDLNGDRHADLVVAHGPESSVSVHLSKGNGSF